MSNQVQLTVPSRRDALPIVAAVVERFAAVARISEDQRASLIEDVGALVRFSLEHAYGDDPTGEIELRLDVAGGELRVDVHDWGIPLTTARSRDELPEPLRAIAAGFDDLRLINLGSDGKRLSASKALAGVADADPNARDQDAGAPPVVHPAGGAAELIEVRDARVDDAAAISRLLYRSYRLTYVHPDFYRPSWVETALGGGTLLSSVAVHEGEVIGHHALMLEPGSASAETGVAVVNPAFRGLGIFNRLSDHTIARAERQGLDGVYGQAVTVHPYSQRTEYAHGYRVTALMLGAMPANVEMRGVEGARRAKRSAWLRAFRALMPAPRLVRLPTVYRERVRAIYANAGLEHDERREPMQPLDGDPMSVSEDAARAVATLTINSWDKGMRPTFRHDSRQLVADHNEVVYIDVDLQAVDDVDDAVDALNELGYFLCGVVPFGAGGRDFLRLQRLNAREVELERIVCDSPFAKTLRDQVLEDRARVA